MGQILSFLKNHTNLQTKGNEEVWIFGQYFGALNNEVNIRAWYTRLLQNESKSSVYSVNNVITAKRCFVKVIDTVMVCISNEGVGKSFQWHIEIDGQNSTLFSDDTNTRYRNPNIVGVLNNTHLPTAVVSSVLLSGTDFGP